MKVFKYIDSLVKNNTGVSSKNFAVVSSVLIAVFSLINVILMIWMDAIFKLELRADLIYALSVFVGAVEGIVAVMLGLKIYGDVKDPKEQLNHRKEKLPNRGIEEI